MKIKPDAPSLGGYRLPTDAEWEYACRGGAETSRYRGASEELLGRYAWYTATAQDHAWPCGSLLPNELGLFDMLGNVNEWCQDGQVIYQPDVRGQVTEPESTMNALMDDTNTRLLRGGAFYSPSAFVRAVRRIAWQQPQMRSPDRGFRPSRTCN
jgi:formylglycine-generating enzyme required for sulfatase activity